MRILVVDDEPVDIKLVNQLLICAGHDVQQSRSAEDALIAVLRRQPDIIVADLQLPGMDGMELVRILRNDWGLRNVRIAAVTAYEQWSERQALQAGFDVYFRKPISTRTFAKRLVGGSTPRAT